MLPSRILFRYSWTNSYSLVRGRLSWHLDTGTHFPSQEKNKTENNQKINNPPAPVFHCKGLGKGCTHDTVLLCGYWSPPPKKNKDNVKINWKKKPASFTSLDDMILSIPCWCKNEFLLLLLLLTGCLVFVTASIFAVSTKNVPSVKWKLGKNGHSSERIIRQVAVRTMKENITRAVQVFFFFSGEDWG